MALPEIWPWRKTHARVGLVALGIIHPLLVLVVLTVARRPESLGGHPENYQA